MLLLLPVLLPLPCYHHLWIVAVVCFCCPAMANRTRRVRLNDPDKPEVEGADTAADGVSRSRTETRRRVDPPQGGILLVRNGGGRPPGVENKLPRSIKDAIRAAMELHGEDGKGSMGMTGFMLNLLKLRPELFVSLVRRTLPVQLKAELDADGLMARVLQAAAAQRAARGEANGAGQLIDVTPLRRPPPPPPAPSARRARVEDDAP